MYRVTLKRKLQEVIEIDLSSQHCNIEKIFNSLNVGIYKGGELKNLISNV